jgi:hypothetical protein
MASLTRISLAPTARTLASGVPAARAALNLPPAPDHHHGPRADTPAKFAAYAANGVSSLRVNGGYLSLLPVYVAGTLRRSASEDRSDEASCRKRS